MNEYTEERARTLKMEGVSVVTAAQILATKYGPEAWAVEGLIPEQSITAVAGIPGSFKTWLALEIGRSVSLGEPFFGQFKTAQGPVLFVDKENHRRHVQKRFRQLGITEENHIYYHDQYDLDLFIDDGNHLTLLLKAVEHLLPRIVVFDSFARIHKGDENEVRSISVVMNRFKQITNQGASVVFTHHYRKEGLGIKRSVNSVRGSTDILAGIDSLLVVEKLEKENRLIINQAKLRQQEAVAPFAVDIQVDKEKDAIKFVYAGPYDPHKTSRDEAKEIIVSVLETNGDTSRQVLTDRLSEEDHSKNTTTEALKELEQEGRIEKTPGPHNKHVYSLKR